MAMMYIKPKEDSYINPTLIGTPDGDVANIGYDIGLGGGGGITTILTTIIPAEAVVVPKKEAAKVNPYTNTFPVVTPSIPYNVPVAPPSSLNGVVVLSKTTSDRQYTKGTLRNIGNDFIVSTNTSNVLTVTVTFTGTAGVSFEPSYFNLSPLEQKTVTVHFDPVQFENLPEGLNQIHAIVDVAAISSIEQAVTTTRPAVALDIAYQPPDNPALKTFPVTPAKNAYHLSQEYQAANQKLLDQQPTVANAGVTGGDVAYDNIGDTYVFRKANKTSKDLLI